MGEGCAGAQWTWANPATGSVMAAVGSCAGPSPSPCGSGHFAGLNVARKERGAAIFQVWRGTAVCEGTIWHHGMKARHPRHSLSHGAKSRSSHESRLQLILPKAQSREHGVKTPIMHRLEARDFMEQLLPQAFWCLNQCLTSWDLHLEYVTGL